MNVVGYYICGFNLFKPFTEVNEDVLSLKWIPNSATEMVVATENSLMICDTRDSSWPVRNLIEE